MRKVVLTQVLLFLVISILSAGRIASAAVATYNFLGAVTYLDSSNNVFLNGGFERTRITGTFTIDSVGNSGNISLPAFSFQGSDWTTSIASFVGGSSNQLFLDYTANWLSYTDMSMPFVLDATGFFGGTGAVPASDSAVVPANAIGPTTVASTTKNWNPLLGTGSVTDDGIGGGLISGASPLDGMSFNLDILSMILQSCEIGGCQSNPVMPTIANPGAGFFEFSFVGNDLWFDPESAFGYEYTMTDGSLFTDILNFPTGFNSLFQIEADGNILGLFGPGESIDFVALLGQGVSQFRVTGINPETESSDPAAFPIQLAFNADTASFNMQALTAVPVPASVLLFGSGLLGMIGVARKKSM